jgi:Short-chain dehydrogenases of various substrate specificities
MSHTRNTSSPQHTVLTGASGGIGSALAERLTRPGTHLTLCGRDAARLEAAASRCRNLGALVRVMEQDLCDREDTRERLLALDEEQPVDRLILNAGVSAGVPPGRMTEQAMDACRVMEVNGLATISMAASMLERMAARRTGHLVFISSLAALYPLAGSPTYCAAKSAVSVYARAIRSGVANHGVRVTIVYPGYVDTPMSRRVKGAQPFRWDAARAADHIAARLDAAPRSITFPKILALGMLALNLLPAPLAALCERPFDFAIEPEGHDTNGTREQ